MTMITIHKRKQGGWVLKINSCLSDGQKFCRVYLTERLIRAINLASELQLHVTNINELPLNQYLNEIKSA